MFMEIQQECRVCTERLGEGCVWMSLLCNLVLGEEASLEVLD